MLHKHRILPGHMGGTYTPENVIRLTIPEHAEAHHQLFLAHGCTADYVAWKMLSGQMGKEDAFLAIAHSPERRLKISVSMRGKRNSLGHKDTPKTRMRKSEVLLGNQRAIGNSSALGLRWTPEQRMAQSVRLMGNQNARKRQ